MSNVAPFPDRMLPHSPEAERSCLGAALVEGDCVTALAETLTPKHFYLTQHRLIFEAMLALFGRSEMVDLVSVKNELGDDIQRVGGPAYLAGLMDGMPRITNPEHWIRILQREAQRRAVINLCNRLASQVAEGAAEPEELMEAHVESMRKAAELTGAETVKPLGGVVQDSVKQLEDYTASIGGLTGIPTGLPDLDRMTRGLRPGALWIVAARPGRGKSALCAQIASHAAMRGARVLMFAMEMPAVDVVERMILSEAGVGPQELRENRSKWDEVVKAAGRLIPLPIRFDSRETPTLAQVKATARQEKAKGLDLIIVDYLQRMNVDTKVDRWLAVGLAAQGLKSLAMSLRVPVLAACQLTADAEDKKRPTMADLAQARQIIAAEADLIALLHPVHGDQWREHEFPAMTLFVDKQRKGPMGEIPLSFERSRSRFVCLAKQEGR